MVNFSKQGGQLAAKFKAEGETSVSIYNSTKDRMFGF
jgi:hypothetical protein